MTPFQRSFPTNDKITSTRIYVRTTATKSAYALRLFSALPVSRNPSTAARAAPPTRLGISTGYIIFFLESAFSF
uniref:Uncharacterized protein n=1 Tax=viral metagenome TaxID=1070528 RepID=A0A6C0K549_9ZZZZ